MFSRKGFVFWGVLLVLIGIAAIAVFRMSDKRADETVVVETAKSGVLKVGVEQALAETAGDIVPVFGRYYPDASIELETASFEDLFNRFLQKEIGAMLWRGLPGEYEVSLLGKAKIQYRLEPVAKSAIICIVNAANPLQSICLEDLVKIYTAKKNRWDNGIEIKAYLNNNDIRLQKQFLAMTAPGQSRLTAWRTESDEELIKLVAREAGAVVIMPLSSALELMPSLRAFSSVRIVALCKKRGAVPVMPSQSSVYSGEYPLDYIVYYMYRKEKALASGFGAWLAKEGQKGFMRSSLAPYRQPVRVIHLK